MCTSHARNGPISFRFLCLQFCKALTPPLRLNPCARHSVGYECRSHIQYCECHIRTITGRFIFVDTSRKQQIASNGVNTEMKPSRQQGHPAIQLKTAEVAHGDYPHQNRPRSIMITVQCHWPCQLAAVAADTDVSIVLLFPATE